MKLTNRDKEHYVYLLVCPRTISVKYIGVTDSPETRYKSHLTDKNNKDKYRWVRELKDLGHLPVMDVVGSFTERQEAERLERELIRSYGYGLFNQNYIRLEANKIQYKINNMRVNTYFPDEMREDIEEFQKLAEKERRSVSWYFQQLVRDKAEEYRELKSKQLKDEH